MPKRAAGKLNVKLVGFALLWLDWQTVKDRPKTSPGFPARFGNSWTLQTGWRVRSSMAAGKFLQRLQAMADIRNAKNDRQFACPGRHAPRSSPLAVDGATPLSKACFRGMIPIQRVNLSRAEFQGTREQSIRQGSRQSIRQTLQVACTSRPRATVAILRRFQPDPIQNH